ncbi:MAG: HAD-IC family P-type ATPase, partial [Planctomycetota bacterium]
PLSRAVAALAAPAAPSGAGGGAGDPRSPRGGWIELESWEEVRGRGVVARFRGVLARLGSLEWLESCDVPVAEAVPFVSEWSAAGATILGLSVGDRLRGVFALRDELKPEAPAVVRELERRGLRVYLVSGDSERTAKAIAAKAGIRPENVSARVSPEEKARVLEALQVRGERAAFAGDGINDAPALERADLGIAVSRASDVAREAADVVLLHADLHAVPEALELAGATLRTIRQNLFWAFFYNSAAVPLAALGFLNPIVCAAAMGLSDVIVIGNALRLERYGRKAGERAACPGHGGGPRDGARGPSAAGS